jgi:hypothetical protein
MATANLNNESSTIDTSNDGIIIVDNMQSIRGGRTLAVDQNVFSDQVIPAGHVVIKETATGDYKPMPIVNEPNGVATVNSLVGGTGYTTGTYENVPLQGGSGSGALGTVVVGAGGDVTGVTITKKGKDYKVGDVLTVPGAYAGGTATTNSTVTVATLAGGTYDALPSGHTYAGINISTIPVTKPFAGILVRGTVNPTPMKYDISGILAAVKTALPLIDFRAD